MELATILRNIERYCKEHSITNAEFERKCGISNGLVRNWRLGTYGINLKTLERIAEGTGIPVSRWLVDESEEHEQHNNSDVSPASKSA